MKNEIAFPAVIGAGIYDSSIYGMTGSTLPRTVGFYELELPAENGGVLHIDGEGYPITPDIAVATKPGQRRFTETPYRCRYIHLAPIDCQLCRELDRLPNVIGLTAESRIHILFAEVTELANKNPLTHGAALKMENANLIIYARLLEIIALLAAECRSLKAAAEPLPPSIAAVLSYIDTHPGSSPRLDELAGIAHMSPVYLHRLFTRVMGTTPYRFMLDRKMTLAKNLLLTTNRSCLEIALELGFMNQSYFNYTFRREVGKSPGAFRRLGG